MQNQANSNYSPFINAIGHLAIIFLLSIFTICTPPAFADDAPQLPVLPTSNVEESTQDQNDKKPGLWQKFKGFFGFGPEESTAEEAPIPAKETVKEEELNQESIDQLLDNLSADFEIDQEVRVDPIVDELEKKDINNMPNDVVDMIPTMPEKAAQEGLPTMPEMTAEPVLSLPSSESDMKEISEPNMPAMMDPAQDKQDASDMMEMDRVAEQEGAEIEMVDLPMPQTESMEEKTEEVALEAPQETSQEMQETELVLVPEYDSAEQAAQEEAATDQATEQGAPAKSEMSREEISKAMANKFVTNELAVFLLPYGDIVLGEITEEAKQDNMSFADYEKAMWNKYQDIRRTKARKVIVDFVDNYDKNFN